MPLTKFKLSSIADGGISTAKLADDAVTGGKIAHDPHVDGTEAIRIPQGTTAQRANALAGDQRFNTTLNLMEYYDGTQWKSIDSPPVVSSISPTTETDANANITITGSNFQSGATVKFIGNDGTEYSSPTVTFNSSTEIVATTPATPLGSNNEPYDIAVTNPSGLTGTLADALDAGSPPTFDTAAGAHTMYNSGRAAGFDASATDPDGDTITYSLQSGSLPAGGTLNTSTGIITGISQVGSDTTSTFTIRASTVGGDTTDRQFVLTVKAPITQTFNYTGSAQSFSVPAGINTVTATMWGAAGGGSIGETVQGTGGAGGFATGDINVSSISSFAVIVGGGGGITGNGSSRGSRAYPNGGLGSLRSNYESGHGGGLSGVFNGSFTFANSLIIAGGGGGSGGKGGAGVGSTGGHGGGSTGGGGHSSNAGGQMTTTGATQSAGGVVTAGSGRPNGTLSGQLQGGDAGDGQVWSTGWNATGGGGSGYYGGGCIDDNHAGGGGGSGYVHPTLTSNTTLTGLGHAVSGSPSSISPPQTGNTHYSSGIGQGNLYANGGNGKVVISY